MRACFGKAARRRFDAACAVALSRICVMQARMHWHKDYIFQMAGESIVCRDKSTGEPHG
jgi:hypothetical protein